MAQVLPLKLASGVLRQMVAGTDTIVPGLIGTGTADTGAFLRGDGTWTNTLYGPAYVTLGVKTTAINSHANMVIDRFATANSFARMFFQTNATSSWSIGLRAGDDDLHFFHEATPADKVILSSTQLFSAVPITLENANYLRWKDNGGTARNVLVMGGDNNLYFSAPFNSLYYMAPSWHLHYINGVQMMSMNSNGVGIGVGISPDASFRLHVVNTVNGAAKFESTGGITYVQFKSNNGGGNYGSQLQFVDNAVASAQITSIATGWLVFGFLNSNAAWWNSTGLGIGTTPAGKLDVSRDGVRGTYTAKFGNSGYAYNGFAVPAGIRAGVFVYGAYIGGQPDYVLGDLSTGIYSFVPSGGHGASGVAAVFDRPEGNVRTVFMGGANGSDTIYAEKTFNTSTGLPMYMKSMYASQQSICSTATAAAADLMFLAHDHDTTFSRLWIQYAGRSTTSSLYVNPSMPAANAAMIGGVNLSGLTIGLNNDVPIAISTASIERMRIQSGSTGTRVYITGSASGGLGAELRLHNTAGSYLDAAIVSFWSSASVRAEIRSTVQGGAESYAGDLTFSTGQGTLTKKMTIAALGNVGIGEGSSLAGPSVKLQVTGPNANAMTLGSVTGPVFGAVDPSGQYGLFIGTAAAGYSWIQVGRLNLTATAYALVLQNAGGNVGIGVVAPRQALDVVGSIVTDWLNATPRFIGMQYSDGSAYFLGLRLNPDARHTDLRSHANDNGYVTISTGPTPTERMRFATGGQIIIAGFGTAAVPAISFGGLTNTGFSYIGGNLTVSVIGTAIAEFSASTLIVNGILSTPANPIITGAFLQINGAAAPTVGAGARFYLDPADGDLKIKFPNGTIRVLAFD